VRASSDTAAGNDYITAYTNTNASFWSNTDSCLYAI
jgi:hypothetical protein